MPVELTKRKSWLNEHRVISARTNPFQNRKNGMPFLTERTSSLFSMALHFTDCFLFPKLLLTWKVILVSQWFWMTDFELMTFRNTIWRYINYVIKILICKSCKFCRSKHGVVSRWLKDPIKWIFTILKFYKNGVYLYKTFCTSCDIRVTGEWGFVQKCTVYKRSRYWSSIIIQLKFN